MRGSTRSVFVISTTLLLATASALARADSDTPQTAATDRQIYDSLRTVINAGADLYNKQNDRAGCYRLYQGALLTVRPLLGSHPELQQAIDAGLADADRQFRVEERAFGLRKILDQIRAKLRPSRAAQTPVAAKETPPPKKEIRIEHNEPRPESLWNRLGGEAKVRQIVDDWLARAAVDPKVNFSRGGKYNLTDAQVTELKNKLVHYLSQATGGPLKPPISGKDMRELHKGMHITNAEFDAAVADLKKSLDGRGVGAAEAHDLITLVESTRKDVVETPAKSPEKSEPKKGE
jgi:truncated hemoglobin YjbI